MFCFRCGNLVTDNELFCGECGTRKRHPSVDKSSSEEDAITEYFYRGFEYTTILQFLQRFHQIEMSLSTLKRRLRTYGLQKRKAEFSEDQVKNIIKQEIENCPSSLLGYRSMWNKLKRTYRINIPRDRVMEILKELDPEATEERKSRRLRRRVYSSNGPNYVWHIDGYDKLKPYGLPIHGCVDGFSRKILWLCVCKTNNDPVIPACHFLRVVKEKGFCPEIVRTDCGTENGDLAAIQCTLTNNENGHHYGSSITNQRIENWWSHCRRGFSNWLINYFKTLVDNGIHQPGNKVHLACIQFVYRDLLQSNLDCVRDDWNNHFIRRSNNSHVWGIPDELYYFPENWEFEDCGIEIGNDEIAAIETHTEIFEKEKEIEGERDDELIDYFKYIIEQYDFEYPPRDWEEGKKVFQTIMNNYE